MAHRLQCERIGSSDTQRIRSFRRFTEQPVELRQEDTHRNQKTERRAGDCFIGLVLDTNKNMVTGIK